MLKRSTEKPKLGESFKANRSPRSLRGISACLKFHLLKQHQEARAVYIRLGEEIVGDRETLGRLRRLAE